MPGMFGTSVSTGAATVLSGAASALRDHLEAGFPPRFFKYVHVVDSNVVLARSIQNAEDWKKPSRRMRITPSYSLDRPEHGGAIRMNRLHRPRERVLIESTTHMTPLYENEDDLRFIRFDLDRYRTTFELGFHFETPLQAANFRLKLEEMIFPEEMHYIDGKAFPVRLPRHMVGLLARDLDISPPGRMDRADVNKLIEELQGFSRHPLDWRVDPTNGQGDVVFFWRSNFLVGFERPTITTESKEQVVSSSVVATSCWMEFSFPIYFVYASTDMPEYAEERLDADGFNFADLDRGPDHDPSEEAIYMFFKYSRLPSSSDDLHDAADVPDGLRMRFHQGFAPQINDPVDTLDFLNLVDPDLGAYIDARRGTEEGRRVLDETLKCVLVDHTFKYKDAHSSRTGDEESYVERITEAAYDADGLADDQFYVDWRTVKAVIANPTVNTNHQFAIYMDWALLRSEMMDRAGITEDDFSRAMVFKDTRPKARDLLILPRADVIFPDGDFKARGSWRAAVRSRDSIGEWRTPLGE